MSTIVAQTLSNGTVSTSTANCIQGSAKAWCSYNGTAGSIRSSYNISSVTKNGTGDYTFNFTNAMPNADYAAITTGGQKTINWGIPMFANGTPLTTTSVRFTYQDPSDTVRDSAFQGMVVFSL
jgi:hypothetical protein